MGGLRLERQQYKQRDADAADADVLHDGCKTVALAATTSSLTLAQVIEKIPE